MNLAYVYHWQREQSFISNVSSRTVQKPALPRLRCVCRNPETRAARVGEEFTSPRSFVVIIWIIFCSMLRRDEREAWDCTRYLVTRINTASSRYCNDTYFGPVQFTVPFHSLTRTRKNSRQIGPDDINTRVSEQLN